jgi:O-antigen/teichoic acid export membrane protein
VTNEIARNTLRTTLVLALRLAIQAGNLLAVTRLLGPGGFGAFAGMAALAIMLGALSSWGSHLVLLREMSRDAATSERVLPFALGATMACGSFLLLVFLVITKVFLPSANIELPVLLAVGVTELWLQPLLVIASIDLQADGKIASSQLLLTLPLTLRLAGTVLIMGNPPARPLGIYAIVYIAASVISLVIGVRNVVRPWPSPSRWRLPCGHEWKDACGFAALNLSAMGPTELDKTLALRLLPLPVAGVYAASARVVGALVLPVMALMLATLPRLFRDSHGRGAKTLLRGILASALIYGLSAAGLLLAGAQALEWMFGRRYDGMASILHWLAIAVPGMALRIAAGNALMSGNHPWLRAGTELLGLGILCTTAMLLVPINHQAGMPLALACSEWSMAIAGWFLVLRKR